MRQTKRFYILLAFLAPIMGARMVLNPKKKV